MISVGIGRLEDRRRRDGSWMGVGRWGRTLNLAAIKEAVHICASLDIQICDSHPPTILCIHPTLGHAVNQHKRRLRCSTKSPHTDNGLYK